MGLRMNRSDCRGFVAGMAVVALAACSTQVSPQMQERAADAIAPGQGRLVVIRPSTMADAITHTGVVHLFVDGRDRGELQPRSYQVVDLPPGEHEVRLRRLEQSVFTALNQDGSRQVSVAAGSTVYLRCMTVRENHLNTVNLVLMKTSDSQGRAAMSSLQTAP